MSYRNPTSAELRAATERREREAERALLPSASGDGANMEVAHVLFMDIVGYSTLRTNQQANAKIEMQNLVNNAPEVKKALAENKFICRTSGDEIALLFMRDVASPVRAALQIHEAIHRQGAKIQERVGAPLKLRMGVHSGVVLMVEDINAQSDAAGEGINIAQRVMDCGDADHILVSAKVAESLLSVDPWQHFLRDLGTCRVKHGVVVHLYLLHGRLTGGYYGNVAIPSRVAAAQAEMEREATRYRGTFFERYPHLRGRLAALAIFGILGGGGYYGWTRVPAFKKGIQTAYASVVAKLKPGSEVAAENATNKGSGKGDHHSSHTTHSGRNGERRSGTVVPRQYEADGSPSRVLVPDLMGKGIDEAQGLAENQGLHVAKDPPSVYNTEIGEGLICRQSPEAGSLLLPDGQIHVEISKGEAPSPDPNAPSPPP